MRQHFHVIKTTLEVIAVVLSIGAVSPPLGVVATAILLSCLFSDDEHDNSDPDSDIESGGDSDN